MFDLKTLLFVLSLFLSLAPAQQGQRPARQSRPADGQELLERLQQAEQRLQAMHDRISQRLDQTRAGNPGQGNQGPRTQGRSRSGAPRQGRQQGNRPQQGMPRGGAHPRLREALRQRFGAMQQGRGSANGPRSQPGHRPRGGRHDQQPSRGARGQHGRTSGSQRKAPIDRNRGQGRGKARHGGREA
jgi:hypothetical protein